MLSDNDKNLRGRCGPPARQLDMHTSRHSVSDHGMLA